MLRSGQLQIYYVGGWPRQAPPSPSPPRDGSIHAVRCSLFVQPAWARGVEERGDKGTRERVEDEEDMDVLKRWCPLGPTACIRCLFLQAHLLVSLCWLNTVWTEHTMYKVVRVGTLLVRPSSSISSVHRDAKRSMGKEEEKTPALWRDALISQVHLHSCSLACSPPQ